MAFNFHVLHTDYLKDLEETHTPKQATAISIKEKKEILDAYRYQTIANEHHSEYYYFYTITQCMITNNFDMILTELLKGEDYLFTRCKGIADRDGWIRVLLETPNTYHRYNLFGLCYAFLVRHTSNPVLVAWLSAFFYVRKL